MIDVSFLLTGFVLGVAQSYFWPQPWVWAWGKVAGLFAAKAG